MSLRSTPKQPTLLHQHVSGRVYRALAEWVDGPSGYGTVMLPLCIAIGPVGEHTPGLMWFEDDLPPDTVHAPGMPALLVRVDDAPGADDWQYGPRELWRVDLLRRMVVVHRSDGTWERREDDALISPQLPGFEIRVDALFPG